jgi:hypothetical protein
MNREEHFEIMNSCLVKYLTDPWGSEASICKGVPIKFLSHFKAVTSTGKGNKVRYRYRGPSTSTYKRDPSYMHMNNATTFALYHR